MFSYLFRQLSSCPIINTYFHNSDIYPLSLLFLPVVTDLLPFTCLSFTVTHSILAALMVCASRSHFAPSLSLPPCT